jgi:hypothetical protein
MNKVCLFVKKGLLNSVLIKKSYEIMTNIKKVVQKVVLK